MSADLPSRISCATTERARGVSRDGLQIVWHLRRGVRWSDGASFDARDVAFTIRTNVDPRNNEIGGSEGWNLIARVETPDPYTVVYRRRISRSSLRSQPYAPTLNPICGRRTSIF